MIVVGDLIEQVLSFWDEGGGVGRFVVGKALATDDFKGTAEADTVEALHELDDVSSRAAGHAVKKAFAGTHDQVGGVVAVFMKRAFGNEIAAAVFLEREAPGAKKGGEVSFAFEAIDFGVRDSGHKLFF